MVEPTDLRERDHLTHLGRLVLSRFGAIVVEGLVRPRLVVVDDVLAKNAPEMLLVQNDDVIEALSTYGADQPFAVGILPMGISAQF